MRRLFSFLCVLVLVFSITMPVQEFVWAEEDDDYDFNAPIDADRMGYQNSPMNKAGRGVMNTATCWAEIPAQVCQVSKNSDPLQGITIGTAQGVVTTLVRGATGLFDLVTCVIPPYDKPVMKPEYAVTRADDEFKDYLW